MSRILLLVLVLASTPAWSINKCIDGTGRVTYSDKTCPSGQRESNVEVRDTFITPQDGSESPAATSADDSAWEKNLARGKQRSQIQEEMGKLEADTRSLRRQLDEEIASLRKKRTTPSAGATYESVGHEMEATSAAYDARIRGNDRKLDALRSRLAEIDRQESAAAPAPAAAPEAPPADEAPAP